LMDIPGIARAYIQNAFPASTLRICASLKDVVAPPDYRIRCPITLPLAVSISFYPDNIGAKSPYVVHHLIPQLLDAGILNLLIDHLLSCDANTQYPWFAWKGYSPSGHPLPSLSSFAVHR